MSRPIEHEPWNDTREFARLIQIYTPQGMEQRFALAGAGAMTAGKSSADGDDYATSRSS